MIVDDILYFNESPFEDGPIAQAVNDVTADGALYFSSAGNEGNTLDGTSGNYESDFRGSGRGVGKFAGEAHDFDPGAGGAGLRADLARLERRRAGRRCSGRTARRGGRRLRPVPVRRRRRPWSTSRRTTQDGDDDPYEILFTPASAGAGLRLAVVRFTGAPRYFQLSALRGRFEAAGGRRPGSTPGVHARAFRGADGVQHRRRTRRGAAAVRARAG